MAKQKKTKKTQVPRALEGARDFLFKRMAGISVVVFSLILAWVLVAAFLNRSDYFKIRNIEVKGAQGAGFSVVSANLLKHYKNKNIFKVNIGNIAGELEPQYPDARDIFVKRALPDKLIVDFRFRKPAAILDDGQYHLVDREGVVLVNMDPAKLKNLVVIRGVAERQAGRAKKKNESRALTAALDLIDEIKRARFLDKYGVRAIDASDIKNLSFYLGDDGPVVIIGYENFRDRLNTLKDALKDPRIVLERINYIDIRFKDVAVSPK